MALEIIIEIYQRTNVSVIKACALVLSLSHSNKSEWGILVAYNL